MFLLIMLVSGAAVLFAGCHGVPPANTAQSAEPYFFIQLADPQIGLYANNKDFTRETELYEKAIAHANRLKPTFVVVCGDLINQASNEEQLNELKRITGKLDKNIPICSLPGNHDVGDAPTPESLELFRYRFGKDFYSFYLNGSSFIVINSGVILNPEAVQHDYDRQLTFITEQLEKARFLNAEHIFIFGHHSFYLADEPNPYWTIPSPRREEIWSLFAEYGVRAVFAGHYHRNNILTVDNVEMITSAAVGKPFGADPSGLRIVKVYPDHIEHQYYPFDEVPQEVTLK
ncbi:MAG: hypothetical protein GY869_03440 [Planctomycetes bacterium]|nr:hypothetical protein [Planctomycetota bacterium]